nr:palindromic element RPE1 domain-containing protein [Rickettsia asembonensis]
MHNLSYKEEFEGNTERSTTVYINIREDASTGLTYKLPLEGGYARSLLLNFSSIVFLFIMLFLSVNDNFFNFK